MPGASAASVPALADPAGAGGRRWADLRTRTLSAVVLGPAVVACVWYGGWFWFFLMALAAGLLMAEWCVMAGRKGKPFATATLQFVGPAAAMLLLVGRPSWAVAALLVAGAICWLSSHRAVLASGVLYIGFPLLCLAALRGADEAGRNNVLFLVAIVWASDIGAYITGRLVGGRKLAPAISPGKTWSGAAGGLFAATVVGGTVAVTLGAASPGYAALAAGLLGIASQFGDLLESWIKRHFGVKDSGSLIPGHGGLLDRLDGLLAAAAAAFLLMNTGAFGRGGVLWT